MFHSLRPQKYQQIIQSHSVFRIRDVLIRIQIHGSVPLDYESGSCSFLKWLPKDAKKMSFVFHFFAYKLLLIKGYFYIRYIPIYNQKLYNKYNKFMIPERPQKLTKPTDPEHWCHCYNCSNDWGGGVLVNNAVTAAPY
jgi:hypothetical protein